MKQFHLNPKDINQPIQLLGASLIGAVLLVGEFLYASMRIYPSSIVMGWFFGSTAILIFPLILIFIFTLQTKYRNQLQSDHYYNQSQERERLYEEQSTKSEKIKLERIREWLKN